MSKLERIFFGLSFFGYLAFFVGFWALMTVATYFWFQAGTLVTNHTDATIEVTAISRGSSGHFFITFKNGLFPFDPSHDYSAIRLNPDETARLTWDWDDQIIHGFRILKEDGRASYVQIDFRTPKDCCYVPDQKEYIISDSSDFKEVPGVIAQLARFERVERWKSLIKWNSMALFFWGILFIPPIIFFRKSFLRQRQIAI